VGWPIPGLKTARLYNLKLTMEISKERKVTKMKIQGAFSLGVPNSKCGGKKCDEDCKLMCPFRGDVWVEYDHDNNKLKYIKSTLEIPTLRRLISVVQGSPLKESSLPDSLLDFKIAGAPGFDDKVLIYYTDSAKKQEGENPALTEGFSMYMGIDSKYITKERFGEAATDMLGKAKEGPLVRLQVATKDSPVTIDKKEKANWYFKVMKNDGKGKAWLKDANDGAVLLSLASVNHDKDKDRKEETDIRLDMMLSPALGAVSSYAKDDSSLKKWGADFATILKDKTMVFHWRKNGDLSGKKDGYCLMESDLLNKPTFKTLILYNNMDDKKTLLGAFVISGNEFKQAMEKQAPKGAKILEDYTSAFDAGGEVGIMISSGETTLPSSVSMPADWMAETNNKKTTVEDGVHWKASGKWPQKCKSIDLVCQLALMAEKAKDKTSKKNTAEAKYVTSGKITSKETSISVGFENLKLADNAWMTEAKTSIAVKYEAGASVEGSMSGQLKVGLDEKPVENGKQQVVFTAKGAVKGDAKTGTLSISLEGTADRYNGLLGYDWLNLYAMNLGFGVGVTAGVFGVTEFAIGGGVCIGSVKDCDKFLGTKEKRTMVIPYGPALVKGEDTGKDTVPNGDKDGVVTARMNIGFEIGKGNFYFYAAINELPLEKVMKWVWKDFKTAAPEWLRDSKIMGFNPSQCKGHGNAKAKKEPSDPDCWAYVSVSTCLADQKVGPKGYQLTIKPGVSVAVGIYVLGSVCGAAVSVGTSGLKIAVKAPLIKLPGDIVIAHSKEKQNEGFDFSMELTPKKLAMEHNVFIKLGFILEASTKVKIDGANFEFEMSGKIFDLIEGTVKGRILMNEVKDEDALLQIANGERGGKSPFLFEVMITAGSLFDKLKEWFGGVQKELGGLKDEVTEEESRFKKKVKETDEIMKQVDKSQLAEAKKAEGTDRQQVDQNHRWVQEGLRSAQRVHRLVGRLPPAGCWLQAGEGRHILGESETRVQDWREG
jgi:hypothetical protein